MIIDTKKVVSAFVGLVTGLAMSGATAVMPLVAQADTVSDLQTQIAQMLAQIQVLQAQLSATTGATAGTGYQFTEFMKLGSKSSQVMELQKVLNMDPATRLAATGAGSPGLETSYFGSITRAAVLKFQTKYGLAADGLVGKNSRAILNGMGGTAVVVPPTVITGTDLVVALASDTPAAGSIIAGQAVADLAHFTLTNKSSVDAKVTNMKFGRTGISNDATLVNVYLYEGVRRMTDSAAVSQTKITFNDTGAGLITIPAGSSRTISVKADILATSAGQVVGVALESVTSNVTVTTALPIGGHMMSVASATMAGVNFSGTVTPLVNTNVDPQDGYIMWQNNVNISTRAVDLKSVNFRQIGSVATSDLRNFKLYVDGVQVGSTVSSMDSNGYVTFDLTSNPLRLQTGSRIIKLVGDIVGGSTRTFSFSLRQPGDAVFVDSELGQPVLSTADGSAFSARTTGDQTVAEGTLTITKKSDSRAGNIASNSSNVDLAKFEFKAAGEPMKVETLKLYANMTSANLRNASLFANGVQVGSTLNLPNASSYVEYNLGSSLIVTPGSPVMLEVRADVTTSTTTLASGESIQVAIGVTTANNVQKTQSLKYGKYPAAVVTGNSLTVATGALSLSKNAAYGSQTTVDGKTAYKVGSFNLVSGSAESVNLDSIIVKFTGSSTPATQLSDAYVVYGTKTTATKSTVTAGDNTFSINEVLAANGTLAIDVYATLATTFGSTDTVIASSTVSGTTAVSSTAVNAGYIVGQTITIQDGVIAAVILNDSASEDKLATGGIQQKVATYKFTATNDAFTITDIATKLATGSATNSSAVTGVVLKLSGSTTALNGLGTPLNGSYVATSTGLSISVPANTETKVDVYINLNSVGAGAATTTANVAVTLEGFKYQASSGTQGEDATDAAGDASHDATYVVKTKPTLTNMLTAGSLQGATTIAKVKVAADSAGSLNWKKIQLTVSKSATVLIGATSTLQLYTSGGSLVNGTFATTTGPLLGGLDAFGGATSGTLTFVADSEQLVDAGSSVTYEVRCGGVVISGTANQLSISIASAATAIATPNTYATLAGATGSFIWSDNSSLSHSVTTPDWLNDYKISGVPMTGVTLSTNL